MATPIVKRSCTKCSKGAGVATCDGCQQSFCVKHFIEHRQELSHKIENVGQEYDLLQRDLNQQNIVHSLFLQINMWERESTTKIQMVAEVARADLRELLDRSKKELKKSVTKVTDELQSCREADDYTEIDINKWIEQLQALRKTFESPSTKLFDENVTSDSVIRLVRVHDQQQHRSSDCTAETHQYLGSNDKMSTSSSSNERFGVTVGDGTLSEEGLVASCTSDALFSTPTIYGNNQYSSGTYHIQFRIEKIGELRIFFGTSIPSEKIRKNDCYDPYLCGWWDLDTVVVNGRSQKRKGDRVIKTGDEMTLTLDCDNRQIQLRHCRTNRLVQQTIDLNNCPFPWKAVVRLQEEDESIRILQ